MKLISEIHPPTGHKFVALFNDGSGAKLFLKDDYGQIYDVQMEPCPLDVLDDFSHWELIPDNYKFWGETA